jgi:hypothetical protein
MYTYELMYTYEYILFCQYEHYKDNNLLDFIILLSFGNLLQIIKDHA